MAGPKGLVGGRWEGEQYGLAGGRDERKTGQRERVVREK